MKRILFIDGSNLYGGMSELLKPGEYLNFAELLKIMKKDFDYTNVNFYGTYMRINPDQPARLQRRAKAQVEFFNEVKKCPKVSFVEGHFSPSSGKEKGVDVKLASDMVLGAAINTYREAMIMTGDADLLYAVQLVRKLGAKVSMGAFASRFPYQMVYHVDGRFVYDFGRYFKDKVLPTFRKRPHNLNIRELSSEVSVRVVDAEKRKPGAHHAGYVTK